MIESMREMGTLLGQSGQMHFVDRNIQGNGDTFGTVEDCDMAQKSRCKLLQREPAPVSL